MDVLSLNLNTLFSPETLYYWLIALPLEALTRFSERTHYLYLTGAVMLAFLVYKKQNQHTEGNSTSFLSYLFPKSVYGHQSAKTDYVFAYINIIVLALMFLWLAPFISKQWQHVIEATLPTSLMGVLGVPTLISLIVISLGIIIVFDFALFCQHYLSHKLPFFWEFHKVHHSAQVLTPVTLFRVHPVDAFTAAFTVTIYTGLFNAVLAHVYLGGVPVWNIAGVNIFLFLYYVFGYNLRHSHVWLLYSAGLSKLLISPALHQVHHSAEERHWDKNFGFIFSIWDRAFNTFYYPDTQEGFSLGLSDKDETNQYQSVWRLFLAPFAKALRTLRTTFSTQPTVAFSTLMVLGAMGVLMMVTSLHHPLEAQPLALSESQESSDSVFLEELTWPEVQTKLDAGFDTVIVPTGGTEQNGRHVILGKHNKVIQANAKVIAEELSNTLVAPVIAYVPEGTPETQGGHMQFAGTLSVSEDTFERTLTDTAQSLKHHGFKWIFFLGDSGGNQASQSKVADVLSKMWRDDNVHVVSLDHYYFYNGQDTYLKNKGVKPQEIGTHAGIKDTSEMLYLYPRGVRTDLIQDTYSREKDGSDGAATIASSKLGKTLSELKIKATIKQVLKAKHIE